MTLNIEIPEELDRHAHRIASAAVFGWVPPRPDGPAGQAVGALIADAVWHECGEDMGNMAQELDSLGTVSDLIRGLEGTLLDYATRARLYGASWEQVGKALGISRQAAQQRYGRNR